VFVMAGAAPRTEWLEDSFVLDKRGFIVTGLDLAAYPDAQWPLNRSPLLLETSVPGIFAVGDTRAGSVKRVASAVGEGAMAVHLVHRYLADSEDQYADIMSKDLQASFAGRQSPGSMMAPFSNGSADSELAK
jgi:thioredoxin reductase (NADPH)